MLIQLTNLHLNVAESDIQRLFTPFGEIASVLLMRDQRNNRSRGIAFVEMPVKREAQNAVLQLHGTVLAGKNLDVTAVS